MRKGHRSGNPMNYNDIREDAEIFFGCGRVPDKEEKMGKRVIIKSVPVKPHQRIIVRIVDEPEIRKPKCQHPTRVAE